MIEVERAIRQSLRNFAQFGDFRFTRRQLYYEVCRVLRSPNGLELSTAATLFGLSALPSALFLAAQRRRFRSAAGLLTLGAAAAGGLVWLRRRPQTLAPPLAKRDFEAQLDIYWQQNERQRGLIEIQAMPKPAHYPPDLALYGLPRLLVCESDETAQMLRVNLFYLEASCAVLSLNEATPLGDVWQKMLGRTPHAKVFFLHDASLTSFSLLPTLREQLKLSQDVALKILGLRPEHALRLHLFALREQKSGNTKLNVPAYLTDKEKEWLRDGWSTEVAAVHPVRLLRVLRRLILDLPKSPSAWQIRFPARTMGFIE